MDVTLSLPGGSSPERERAFAVDGDTTYADLLAKVGLNAHEVAVLVDGRPVPEDAPADRDATVVRLFAGG